MKGLFEDMELTKMHIEAAVRGGGILGGGGGGRLEEGRRLAREAFAAGTPRFVRVDDVPADAIVVTVSVVGSPAASEAVMRPEDHLRCIRELQQKLDRPIAGLIASENGGAATINGWFQSAALGIPVIDAPADGRAHPTGIMGAMGLERVPGYRSIQVACARDLFVLAEGSVESTSRLVRRAAVEAGGFVAVCRHPVEASYLRANAAVGAITLVLELGEASIRAKPHEVGTAVARRLGGEVIESGKVTLVELETEGGFDRGRVRVGKTDLSFWNEYMTAEVGGRRLATFPDLIVTIDPETGEAFTTAEAQLRQRAEVLVVPKARIPLGAGVRDYVFCEIDDDGEK